MCGKPYCCSTALASITVTLTGVMTELGPLIGKTVTETSKLLFPALFKSPFFLPLCVLFLLFHFSSFLKVMKGDDEFVKAVPTYSLYPKKSLSQYQG